MKCQKIAHRTRSAAIGALETNSRARREKNFVYYCSECGAFHLTRKPNKEQGVYLEPAKHQLSFRFGEVARLAGKRDTS